MICLYPVLGLYGMRPKITFTGTLDVAIRRPYAVYRRHKGTETWHSVWQGYSGYQAVQVFGMQSNDVEAVILRNTKPDPTLIVMTSD